MPDKSRFASDAPVDLTLRLWSCAANVRSTAPDKVAELLIEAAEQIVMYRGLLEMRAEDAQTGRPTDGDAPESGT